MGTRMQWDIFCKVIDNHGDLGVCWRLACQLAAAGERARLWVDDPTALHWMAPAGCDGVQVIDWSDAEAVRRAVADPVPDVLVEAFGCDPEPALIARFAQAPSPAQAWINLEYLSAEPYVEKLHRLPSPVFKGPGAGLTKRFFYPGFTPATGGLLREPALPARQAAFDRKAWLAGRGIDWNGEMLVSLFCYEPPALAQLLDHLAQAGSTAAPVRLLVTAGRATAAVQTAVHDKKWPQPNQGGREPLSISYLPWLRQDDFDHLLWACDLNFVRGEDSVVRALWAGQAFVWQIYPQADQAHQAKLHAFLDMLQAPPSLRQFHEVWNGLQTELPAPELPLWTGCARAARQRLQQQPDLATQLLDFVMQKQAPAP
ncbi:elongation factor P maturation arginine rhamnosyltransferase EarP [Polaromonas sp.]|uniref:elongation factor P maturation arginine rhamnosyltransferase EarP n=1 Tax=Polaromonas sp. TaxID=1869339 RepID=UPI002733763C|nr:elongation factor P maturation arginine rhamnosyltransferase EarP [Polaromonas sp.]MDP3754367.1 elongation factor P maturation arginine rhamnosyltransferase EarP [Polaromonas sp.]